MGCAGYEPSRSVDDECDESGGENHLMMRCAPERPKIDDEFDVAGLMT